LIIGKRYGEKTKNGLSVTHNEFLTIQNRNVPIVTIVDQVHIPDDSGHRFRRKSATHSD
jgi:hypothetical protein